MESAKRQRPETETMRVEDVDALDCGVCCHPLKPPIFQCKEGHALCSSCRDKLAPTGKCHVCGVTTRSYLRCRAMERLVETVRVACPNATHGCNAKLIYYDLPGHRQVCPHAPCHCPSGACSFVGTTKQLVDHITVSHGWPCTTRVIMACETAVSLQLRDGFNFLIVDRMLDKEGTTVTSTTGVFLFLLNVAHQPFGRSISVFCIDPHRTSDGQGTSSNTLKCLVTYWRWFQKRQLKLYHSLSSDLSVESTDLSNGLPSTDECFKFVVPNSALGDGEKEAIHVKVRFSIC